MKSRTHKANDTTSIAVYSDCELYRYALTRCWDEGLPKLAYIMLNPSKADEIQNDPTVERCERRARSLGFGAFRVVNLFAWRETSPALLRKASAPIGDENERVLSESCGWADQVICGWGTHGVFMDRGAIVEAGLRKIGAPLYHLGLTKDGHPRHPLYVSYATQPMPWT